MESMEESDNGHAEESKNLERDSLLHNSSTEHLDQTKSDTSEFVTDDDGGGYKSTMVTDSDVKQYYAKSLKRAMKLAERGN